MEKRKVLIVDDDPSVLEILKDGLVLLGFSVFAAGNECDFRSALQTFCPDAILMDVNMPGVDGISLCREIRHAQGTAHVPIIMVTALSDSRTYHDAMLFGATDLVTKPFDLDDLKKKLDDAIAKADAKRGTRK